MLVVTSTGRSTGPTGDSKGILMSRTLTSRGLAVVFVGLAVLGLSAGPATAWGWHPVHRPHHLAVTGTWLDPGGTIDQITVNDAGTAAQVDLHGGTITKGGFAGTSTYTLSVSYDLATNVSDGYGTERYAATLGRWGQGHVTFSEHVHVAANGDTVVDAFIVGGDGVFRGAHGYARFQGTSTPVDPSNPNPSTSSGPYVMWVDLAH